MILAKARVINGVKGTVCIGLTFPTGFDPDEVVKDSIRVNGGNEPESVSVKPRRGTLDDIYREFEVFVSSATLEGPGSGDSLEISGRMRRGLKFTATVARPIPAAARENPTDN